MAVTYKLVIESDLPKNYTGSLKNLQKSLDIAKQKYEELIDFINMNQGEQFEQLQLSRTFFETLESRFVINPQNLTPHIFTRYNNNIIIESDDMEMQKLNLLTQESFTAILTKIKKQLMEFDIHRFGIVVDWKIVNSDGQVFQDFDELTASFKTLTFNKD